VNAVRQKILTGTSGNDAIYGFNTLNDAINGNGGSDFLYGKGGNDTIYGGAGDDFLYGEAGDDILDGGTGIDRITGGAGNDTYRFGTGYGQDKVYNSDASCTTSSGALEITDTGKDNLWFSKSGSNLVVTIAGTTDQFTVSEWYAGASYQLDNVAAGGCRLQNTMVDQLVNAMASYSVPYGAGNTIPQVVQDALAPVLTATWQQVG